MTNTDLRGTLLALDPGVRQTGWAVFVPGQEVQSGVIGTPGRRNIDAQVRLTHLVDCLDQLVEMWSPAVVAHSQPSGIHWAVPSLELLDAALSEWSARHKLPMHPYTAQEVRIAVTGHPNVSKEELAYAVMAGLGLIGEVKTPHEWEAIAVGHYHASR